MDVPELLALAERLRGEPVPEILMSESEFVAWWPTSVRAEWVDGEVIVMAPANRDHDNFDVWLISLFNIFVQENDLGAVHRGLSVRLRRQRRRRIPDLMFVAKERMNLLRQTFLDGAPDLVVEIISPDSQSRDRRIKFHEYESAGVKEYWILDPLSQTLEVYVPARRKFVSLPDVQGVIESTVLSGFKLKTAILWQKPLPKVSSLFRQISRRNG